MIFYKCDICKKDIKDDKEIRVAPNGRFGGYTICEKCGKPVLAFLRKNKLAFEA